LAAVGVVSLGGVGAVTNAGVEEAPLRIALRVGGAEAPIVVELAGLSARVAIRLTHTRVTDPRQAIGIHIAIASIIVGAVSLGGRAGGGAGVAGGVAVG